MLVSKLVNRYRERLSRKFSFEDNIRDVFIKLMSQSDPILSSYRSYFMSSLEVGSADIRNSENLFVDSLIIYML